MTLYVRFCLSLCVLIAFTALAVAADVPALVKALGDESPLVRAQAAEALGDSGDARAVEALATAVKDEFMLVGSRAVTALGKIKSPESVSVLLAVVTDTQSPLRAEAVAALHGATDTRAVAPLLAVLKSPDDILRQAAADALATIAPGDTRVNDGLRVTLADANWLVRLAAVQALGQRKDAASAPAILGLLKDTNAAVRKAAVQALQDIQGDGAADFSSMH